jgi:hypothetical protein
LWRDLRVSVTPGYRAQQPSQKYSYADGRLRNRDSRDFYIAICLITQRSVNIVPGIAIIQHMGTQEGPPPTTCPPLTTTQQPPTLSRDCRRTERDKRVLEKQKSKGKVHSERKKNKAKRAKRKRTHIQVGPRPRAGCACGARSIGCSRHAGPVGENSPRSRRGRAIKIFWVTIRLSSSLIKKDVSKTKELKKILNSTHVLNLSDKPSLICHLPGRPRRARAPELPIRCCALRSTLGG